MASCGALPHTCPEAYSIMTYWACSCPNLTCSTLQLTWCAICCRLSSDRATPEGIAVFAMRFHLDPALALIGVEASARDRHCTSLAAGFMVASSEACRLCTESQSQTSAVVHGGSTHGIRVCDHGQACETPQGPAAIRRSAAKPAARFHSVAHVRALRSQQCRF